MTAYANLGTRRQPMPRPATLDEYLRIRPQMIDTTGAHLVLTSCESCKRQHFTVEPCAAEAPCPRCGSTETANLHEAQLKGKIKDRKSVV